MHGNTTTPPAGFKTTLYERMRAAISHHMQERGYYATQQELDDITTAAVQAIDIPCLVETAHTLEPTFLVEVSMAVSCHSLRAWS